MNYEQATELQKALLFAGFDEVTIVAGKSRRSWSVQINPGMLEHDEMKKLLTALHISSGVPKLSIYGKPQLVIE